MEFRFKDIPGYIVLGVIAVLLMAVCAVKYIFFSALEKNNFHNFQICSIHGGGPHIPSLDYLPNAEKGYADYQVLVGQYYQKQYERMILSAGAAPSENAKRSDPDYLKALEWYKKAAEQDDIGGQKTLGAFYLSTDNPTEAYVWLRIADENPKKPVDRLCKTGTNLLAVASNRLTAQEKEEALKQVQGIKVRLKKRN